MRRRVCASAADERGIAMVMVVLMSAILFMVATTIVARNVGNLNQVRRDRLFVQAIQVADAGVDATLHVLGPNPTWSTDVGLPGSFAPMTEEEWVRAEAALNPVVPVSGGEYAVVKPNNASIVFSVGYVPTRANPQHSRVIRAEYDLAPFVPGAAILTDGNLEISGNPTIDGAAGNAHANGDVEITGSPSIPDGYISASGSYAVTGNPTIGNTEDSGGGKPPRDVPIIDPRENYSRVQYDLCPDGTAKTGPAYPDTDHPRNTSGVPCGGVSIDPASETATFGFRGWRRLGSGIWEYNDPTTYNGAYYIYQGSARVAGNPGSATSPWEVTIMAEAQVSGDEPGHCPHIGGDISVVGNPTMLYHDNMIPLLLVAGRDLEVHGNPGAGQTNYDGILAAHEQFEVGGNPRINGAIIANDYCDTVGSPVDEPRVELGGNAHITYDGGIEVPLGRTIRTTHWYEL
jgi:hypothetical protein